MPALCRDCLTEFDTGAACPACRSRRVVAHDELWDLTIAHMDCDAFYASVEKRDDPTLAHKPVIIGGGRRGVVSTACYVARIRGVRSAMPMFKARKLCPEAVIVKPRMAHYVAVSRQIREMMEALTPAIEPLSLDEAFLDLAGTGRLHGAAPAELLVRLQNRIEAELGLGVSIGLSHNKFLAKIASDLDKPRGFAVIGRAETQDFLARQKVGIIWGVGASARRALEAEGIRTIADLRQRDRKQLVERFGRMGDRLWHLARGEDNRRVSSRETVKSISNETTFREDISDAAALESHLWRLAEKVSARAKAKAIGGRTVVLKLKHADHRIVTRRHTIAAPTQSAGRIYELSEVMLRRTIENFSFRLIGLGLTDLMSGVAFDTDLDFFDQKQARRMQTETVTDHIRSRFGEDSIKLGRSYR